MKRIARYLNSVLGPELEKIGVNEDFIARIFMAVGRQMRSAAAHRTDGRFFRALKVLVSEEAPFYLPADAPEEVKAFVVLTLRNSPFESLQSDLFAETGMKRQLLTPDIIKITSGAVRYFTEEGLPEGTAIVGEDIYGELAKKYPTAWNALEAVGSMQGNSCAFAAAEREDAAAFCEKILRCERAAEESRMNVIEDGFSNRITPVAARQLSIAAEYGGPFYVDCFKMVSRNPEVVLTFLEFLLIKGCAFVTSNYYITNGYAEKRKRIIKAAHNESELRAHLANVSGISRAHREVLLGIKQLMEEK